MIMQNFTLKACRLCPRDCGADRTSGTGYCAQGASLRVAKAMIHQGEEPCLLPAGAVFFVGCNLRCVFCQNYEISHPDSKRGGEGEYGGPSREFCSEHTEPSPVHGSGELGSEHREPSPVSGADLAALFLKLQEEGAATIDLVTPTPWLLQIREALTIAKKQGLHLPVVFNCGGYESAEALRLMEGLVDVYMPDLKYFSSEASLKYSGAADYFDRADEALREMYRQVGPVQFGKSSAAGQGKPKEERTGQDSPAGIGQRQDIMQKGLLVRHLVLPGLYKDSVRLMDYLADTFEPETIRLSLLAQYTPFGSLERFPELRRRITSFEYEKVLQRADERGLEGYRQFRNAATMAMRPDFTNGGLMTSVR
ncbi:MAG: radical SAM protein [Firmicutes bacterium]|nr:radical SAM protein [Bacillota bacterium]